MTGFDCDWWSLQEPHGEVAFAEEDRSESQRPESDWAGHIFLAKQCAHVEGRRRAASI